MKTFLAALVALLLFATPCLAEDKVKCTTEDKVRLTEHIDAQGKRTIYRTTAEIMEKSPVWKMDKEPPLAAHKAVAIAKKWIKEKYPQFEDFEVSYITLSKIWNREYPDRWYYSVSVNATVDVGGVSASSYLSVLILMDGTVVEPEHAKSDE